MDIKTAREEHRRATARMTEVAFMPRGTLHEQVEFDAAMFAARAWKEHTWRQLQLLLPRDPHAAFAAIENAR